MSMGRMSSRDRHAPWFRRPVTMADLRRAASWQFDFELGEEPLDSILRRAQQAYDDHVLGPVGRLDLVCGTWRAPGSDERLEYGMYLREPLPLPPLAAFKMKVSVRR